MQTRLTSPMRRLLTAIRDDKPYRGAEKTYRVALERGWIFYVDNGCVGSKYFITEAGNFELNKK